MVLAVRVLSTFPTYEFEFTSPDDTRVVRDRLRACIETRMGFLEMFAASWDAVEGRVGINSFEFRPLSTWTGNRRGSPRVVGSFSDAQPVTIHVAIDTNVGGAAAICALALAILAVQLVPDFLPAVLRCFLGASLGIALAAGSHYAECTRLRQLVEKFVMPPKTA